VDKLLSDPARTRDITEASRALSREQMVAQDKQAFAAILARYNVDKRLNPQQIATLESWFLKLLDDVYGLTQQILANPESPAAAKFNLEFEAI
jgi:cardiolipin synthase C